ncbi:MAG: hypothetical protein GY694_02425 [Gammaproteobacteria bacterium]|nr:hypothetical protein [Gammaproteobacteria bacterium]
MLTKIPSIFTLFFVIVFFQQATSASSEDDYLKQLESEASNELVDEPPGFIESQQTIGSGNATSLDAPSNDMELIMDKKELVSDRASFEKALKGTYKESYALYVQLTEEQKKVVYQDFLQAKRLYNSTVKIISIYLDTH